MTSKPTKAASTSTPICVTKSMISPLCRLAGGGLRALVNNLPAAPHTRTSDHLILKIQCQLAISDHQAEKRLDVPRVELRRVLSHRRRHVQRRHDLHVMTNHRLT